MHRVVPTTEHVAAFHVSDAFIVSQASEFIAAGLANGERVIALATQAHWNAITADFEKNGVSLGRATADGRLVLIEADQLLETLTTDGHVDVNTFRATLEPLVQAGPKLRIYGEVVSLLAGKGDIEGALAIERLGHDLARTLKVNILCGYHVAAGRPGPSDIQRIQQIHDRSVFEQRVASSEAVGDSHRHAVRFYQDSQSLARIVSAFISEGLFAGSPALVIATPEHRVAVEASLKAVNVEVSRLRRSGDLVFVDAEQLLETFMVEGMPDAARFKSEITPIIERACRGRLGCVVRAYGEMVDVLWKGGHTTAAIKLETLWNQLAQTHDFTLLCGYAMGHFYKAAAPRELHDLHTHVSSDNTEPARLVS